MLLFILFCKNQRIDDEIFPTTVNLASTNTSLNQQSLTHPTEHESTSL